MKILVKTLFVLCFLVGAFSTSAVHAQYYQQKCLSGPPLVQPPVFQPVVPYYGQPAYGPGYYAPPRYPVLEALPYIADAIGRASYRGRYYSPYRPLPYGRRW